MDLNNAAWRKSSYSGGNGGQCVEVAATVGRQSGPAGMCAVRDSKAPAAQCWPSAPGNGGSSPPE